MNILKSKIAGQIAITVAIIAFIIFAVLVVKWYKSGIDELLKVLAIICSFITVISFILYVFDRKRRNISQKAQEKSKHPADFTELYSKIQNKRRKIEIKSRLKELEQHFSINIFEIQIERYPNKDGEEHQRWLTTLCSNYDNPKDVSVWDDEKKYTGQTTYAFIKNRYMWITATNSGCLCRSKNQNVEYKDQWSGTHKKDKIPDFWEIADKSEKNICTSVILPLRIPHLYSAFGFIDFESEQCIKKSDDMVKLFKEIARIFARDYVDEKVKSARGQS